MNRVILIKFLLFVFTATLAQSDPKNIEIVKCFTKALKKQKPRFILKKVITAKDIDFLQRIEHEKHQVRDNYSSDSLANVFAEGALTNYNSLIRKGGNLGINWYKLTIDTIRMEYGPLLLDSVEIANIFITYKSEDKKFSIKLTKCLKLNEKWAIADRFYWLREE